MPRLRKEYADAVFVYLPSVALLQAKNQGLVVSTGVAPVPVQMFGRTLASFQSADSLATASGTTANLNFATTGFTVLAVGTYATPAGVQPIQCLVNRKTAANAGGFNMTLYNTFGGTPASVWSSYNKAGADTNFDSFWVNGAKTTTGNGDPVTVAGNRYALAGNAASGPGVGSSELIIGREPGTSDSQAMVEFIAIWPRKLSEAAMRQITADPYSVFAAPVRLTAGSVAANTAIAPGVGSLAISGFAPTLTQTANQALTPGVGSLAITGFAPSIAQPQAIAPGVGSLALTGFAPTVAQTANQGVSPGVGSVAFTGYAPTLAQTANQALTAGVGSLTLTGYPPTLAQTANQALAPGVGSIAFTGYAPAVTQSSGLNLTPGVGSISFTGYAPALTQTANQAVTPGIGSLAITGYAPTIAQPQSVLPSAGTLAISGYAPTVAQTANQGLVAGAGVLALTGYAPSLTQTANQALVPGVGSLSITGYAPTVVQASSSISANPGAGVLTITGYAPDVYQTGAAAANYEDKKKRRKKIELAMLRAEMEAESMPIVKAPVLTVEHDDDEEVLMLLL